MEKEESSRSSLNDPLIQKGELLSNASIVLGEAPKAEIYYEVSIDATTKNITKTILHRQKGIIPAESFTAILGPSGSGKTTLLNFLSSRLASENLKIYGEIRINSEKLSSLEAYSNQIGYVMQEDALLAPLTPEECFRFAASLTLNLSKEKTELRVQELIRDLGLGSCSNVKIGNALIKGVSGGERKRTSIGVELITNPGVIFLDEPTTGLDSTTALQVILLLKKLAEEGRTVISTIHQPSSELFCEFDRLMLLCDGYCLYHGPSDTANKHFKSMGYECPELMNASEFYLDLMSIDMETDTSAEDGGIEYAEVKKAHEEKILKLEAAYKSSEYANTRENPDLTPLVKIKGNEISIFREIYLIMMRTLICLIRNPMDVGFKLIQSVFTAVIVVIVYGQIDNSQLQNVKGVLFFLVSSNAFGGIQGTLAILSSERSVFLRERYSKIYTTFSYFVGRTATNFPFELIYPTVGLAIVYLITGLGKQSMEEFGKLVLVVNGTYFCSASYGLFYSAIIPKLETAMALVPVLIIPFMLLSGFFININDYVDIRVIFYPVMYLSPFKYGYQSGMIGLDQVFETYTPDDFWENIVILFGLGLVLRIIAFLTMRKISNPKRPKMEEIPKIDEKI